MLLQVGVDGDTRQAEGPEPARIRTCPRAAVWKLEHLLTFPVTAENSLNGAEEPGVGWGVGRPTPTHQEQEQ